MPRTTANGVISTPRRQAATSGVTSGRVPGSQAVPIFGPIFNDGSTPPPDGNTTIPGWTPYNAGLTGTAGAYVVTINNSTGDNYFTINSDPNVVADSAAGKRYTATVQVKTTNAGSVGDQIALVIRERLADGVTVVNAVEAYANLSTTFQTLSCVYDVAGAAHEMDVRITYRNAVTGDSFTIDAAPTVTISDTPSGGGTTASAFDAPYWTGALWRQRIDSLAVDASSASWVSSILALRSNKIQCGDGAGSESPKRYLASDTDQKYSVSVAGYTNANWRCPAGATGGGGSDNPVELYMINHDDHGEFVVLRVWQCNINHTNKTITGTNYGIFRFNNDGRKLSNSMHSVGQSIDSTLSGRQARGAGNGLNYDAGQILRADVARVFAGTATDFGHAIRVAVKQAGISSSVRAPAIKSDQSGTGAPMGARLRLKSTVDCETRTVPTTTAGVKKSGTDPHTIFLRAFCRTVQRYGIMYSDGTTGPMFNVYMEPEETGKWADFGLTERYNGNFGWIFRDNTMADIYSRNAGDGVPWSDIEFVVSVPDVV